MRIVTKVPIRPSAETTSQSRLQALLETFIGATVKGGFAPHIRTYTTAPTRSSFGLVLNIRNQAAYMGR
jgi:hypothetical protein